MNRRICPAANCGQPSLPDRRQCAAGHKRTYRAKHPIRAAFHIHRQHARERGILTLLTYWEFEQFCLVTGYHERCGQESESPTIDRPDADQPYTAHNVVALPRAENSRKWWHTDRPRRMARRAA